MTITSFFCPAGYERLSQIVQRDMLCVFDFDGTLTPIIPQPEKVGLPTDVLQRILKLQQLAPVAIITGRSLADIKPRLEFEPNFIIGNHGLEGLPGWQQKAAYFQQCCETWLVTLTQQLQGALPNAGVWIENKQLSLSVHYRTARQSKMMTQQLMDLFAQLTPAPRVIAGKYVFNLLPTDALDKGKALLQLMQLSQASTAIYVGDDITDEDVFKLGHSEVLSIKVGDPTDSAAEFFLPSQPDIQILLNELIKHLQLLD